MIGCSGTSDRMSSERLIGCSGIRKMADQSRMNELAKRFTARLETDSRMIRELLSELERGNRESGPELERLAHRIAGAAGSFGFEEVSRRAARLEQSMADGQIEVVSAAGRELLAVLPPDAGQ